MSYGLRVTVPADPSVPSGDAPVVPGQARPPLVSDEPDASAAEPVATDLAADPAVAIEAPAPPAPPVAPAAPVAAEPSTGFRVTLANFEGPFDLLLQLIGRHK